MMAKKQEFTYQDGDFVVYPTHGVGKIIGTETTEVAGIEATLMVIGSNRTDLARLKRQTLGLRTPSSRKHMDDILTLKGKAKQ